jgi:hypothetical protein
MEHRSFRQTGSKRQVILRLRLIYAAVTCVYLVLGLFVIGLAMIVGSHTEFFTDGHANWPVLVSFSVMVAFSTGFLELWLFRTVKHGLTEYGAGRWMSSEQARQFPGLYDPWPDSWLEPQQRTTADG